MPARKVRLCEEDQSNLGVEFLVTDTPVRILCPVKDAPIIEAAHISDQQASASAPCEKRVNS
jgi:hypothetical protein